MQHGKPERQALLPELRHAAAKRGRLWHRSRRRQVGGILHLLLPERRFHGGLHDGRDDRSISLDPASTQQAWAAYDVEAYADGYSDILLEGVQVYSGVEAYAPISMLPIFSSQAVSPTAVTADTGSTSREAQQDILHTTIPAPAIRGGSASGPAPLSTCATQPLVLQSVFIPQYITVHLGKPQNSAANETVSFPYYIKNVCSSEIDPNADGGRS